jgi:CheY-like chemotaxis protein
MEAQESTPGSKKILVIDDSAMIRGILSDHLKKRGHTVVVADTMAEGLSRAQMHTPDLIFLDLVLPDGHGTDLLPQLMALIPTPKVVVISGHVLPGVAAKCQALGADRVLTKPFAIRDIDAAIL